VSISSGIQANRGHNLCTRRFPEAWGDFVRAVIDAGEHLQQLKERYRHSQESHTTNKMGNRPDNSKYRRGRRERSTWKGSCAPNCNSKMCRNPRTIYSEFKKGKAQGPMSRPGSRPQKTEGSKGTGWR